MTNTTSRASQVLALKARLVEVISVPSTYYDRFEIAGSAAAMLVDAGHDGLPVDHPYVQAYVEDAIEGYGRSMEAF